MFACRIAGFVALRLSIALLAASAAVAQVNTGRIIGIVSDVTGALMPGVEVKATNEQTGVVTVAPTRATGEYLLNFLVPGSYRVEVEKSGFKKEARAGVVINAGSIENLEFHLKVGDVKDTLEVSASAYTVATESAELSQTFSFKQIDALPNIDRNPLYQMNLMAGANSDRGSGNYGENGGENGSAIGLTRPQLASIGGIDVNSVSVFVEGTFNREPQNGYVGVVPAMEAIDEVQVYTGKYTAEFGFSGAAVVNVITKGGTNQLHGAAFEYLRNRLPDSRPFFAQDKTVFQRNQFGGAVGGPILKNKLFFFGSYQGTYFNQADNGLTSAPTALMMQGNFSELLSPTQGKDGSGNVNGQLYDPYSRKFDANGNVVSATPFPGNIIPRAMWDPASAKMNDAKIFGTANLPGASVDSNLYYVDTYHRRNHQIDGRWDYNSSPKDRFMFRYSGMYARLTNINTINNFTNNGNADSDTLNQNMQASNFHIFGPAMMNEVRLGYNRTRVITTTGSMNKPYNNLYGIPNGNLGDITTQGLAEFSVSPGHSVGDPDWVGFIIGNTLSVTENFTWVKGHHNMKFGTNLNHVQNTSADTMGGDSPRGNLNFSSNMTSYDGNDNGYNYPTFLLGLLSSSSRARFVKGWPYQTYWQNAWYAQDDFKVLPSLTLNLGFRYELSTRPIERYNRQSNWDTQTNQLVVATPNNRSPALNLDKGDYGPRFGFAWTPDHGKTSIRGGYGISYWQTYWSGPLTILGLTYPYYAKSTFSNGSDLVPGLLLSKVGIPSASASYDSSGNLLIPADAVIRGTDINWKNQRVDERSFNVQRELRTGIVLDVGYLGVDGSNNNHTRNLNLAPPGPPGQNYNLRRPLLALYPQLGDIPVQFSETSSYYDAITATLRARINQYVNVYATYAHGRNFANGNNINPADLNQYYGPTSADIEHQFNSQVTLVSPVGRGKAYMADMNKVLDKFIGGWQYSAMMHIRSGTRFGVSGGTSLNNSQTNRVDRIGDGNLPPDQRTLAHWFDTTAFVKHLDWATYGNVGTNPLFADGQVQLDSSLFKDFGIREGMVLQFRVDAFNTFNHPDFNPPNSKVGSQSIGVVTSTSTDPRRFQFGLRVRF
jgi:hypothetical protein